MPMRVSQLSFTADESYLVLSAETGGGLAVYDVQATTQTGNAQAAFELSTNGETLRSLVVNPMADKAELCALVTANGNLLMADLQQRSLRNGPSGQPALRSQVSCAAWSSKGKQLVAGCADGSVYQMTPDGQEKAHIPKPPQLGDYYVASIAWLENDVFLVVHNPNTPGEPSAYHIVTRGKAGTTPEFLFQKLNDPVEPFGDKTPFHTILRLRDFPPNLQDVLLVASTAVENIGLITRSKAPLATDVPAEKITNVFTTTELADDSKRAQMPMSADYNDTFPVGVALDLSSTDKVQKPIPGDEIDESPGPLPGLWALNNEGVLLAWWVVYNDSIRERTTFPGLVAAGGAAPAQPASAFASPKPSAPAFGAVSATPASPAPAFGGASALGSTSSPWGQASAGAAAATPSRAPAFGAPSVLGGSAFGATGGLGAKASPWGKPSGAPAFGQSSFGSAPAASAAPSGGGFSSFASSSNASPFGSAAASSNNKPGASPFGAFGGSSQTGFASLGAGTSSGGSIFASTSSSTNKPSPFSSTGGSSAFGAPSTGNSVFGAPSTGSNSAFGAPSAANSSGSTMFPAVTEKASTTTGSSAFGSSPFILGTTFKADPASANDNEKTPQKSGGLFGGGFGLSLADTVKKDSASSDQKDEDMDAPTPTAASKSGGSFFESTTPTTTPAPAGSRFFSPLTSSDSPAPTSLFGKPSDTTSKTTSMFGKPSGTSLFGKPSEPAATSPSEEKTPTPSLFGKPAETKTPAPSLFGKPLQTAGTAPSLFGKPSGTSTSGSIFGQPSGSGGGLFSSLAKSSSQSPPLDDAKKAEEKKADATKDTEYAKEAETKPKQEENLPLPPDTISKDPYPLGDSSASSGASSVKSIQSIQSARAPSPLVNQMLSNKPVEEEDAPLPPLPPNPFSSKSTKPSSVAEPPLPPNPFTTTPKTSAPAEPPLPPDPFAKPKAKTSAEPPLAPDPFAKSSAKSAAAKPSAGVPEDAPLPPDPFASSKAKPKPKAEDPSAPAGGLLSNTKTSTTSSLFSIPKTSASSGGLFSSFKASSKPSSGMSIFSNPASMSKDTGLNNPFANLKPPPSPTTEGSEEDDEDEEELSEEGVKNNEEDGEITDEDDGLNEEGDEEEDDEGSGTDVGKDISRSTTGLVQTPSFATHASFTTAEATDLGTSSTFSHIEAPRQQLFGDPPVLRAPRQDTSPRSPSPQRPKAKPQAGGAGRLLREDSQRSFSAPGMASHLLRDSSRQGRPAAMGHSAAKGLGGSGSGSGSIFSNRRLPRDTNQEEQRKADEARAAAEAKELAQEDSCDVMDRELDQPLAPTRQLAECLYILDSDISGGDTVASQVEAVYRDINRMVLVLKLNGRNIDAFLRGHSQIDRKTEEDLDDADGWVLCDVDALGAIVSRDLPTKLRQSRVKGESEILADSEALLKDASRLQVMHDDMVRIIRSQASPDQLAAARALPLSAEQATQQNDLRRTFTKFMERLVEAEQQLVLLRTKTAALAAASAGPHGGANGRASPVPTVDAVMRTIARMTAMAEKRSGDIDVLEAQIRKLNLGGRSREGSPFATPQKQQSQQHKRSSLIYPPGGSAQRSAQKRSSVLYASSPGLSAPGTPTRRKLTGYTETEKDQLRQKRAGRQRTLDRLQKIQQAEGPRYMPMDD